VNRIPVEVAVEDSRESLGAREGEHQVRFTRTYSETQASSCLHFLADEELVALYHAVNNRIIEKGV
jgi:hypothetical protein